jgi:hypothetical protein
MYSNNTRFLAGKRCHRGLRNWGNVFKAETANKITAFIITKGVDAILLPQVSSGDLTTVYLRLMMAVGTYRDVIVELVYMP